MRAAKVAALLVVACTTVAFPKVSRAEDTWKPFAEKETGRRSPAPPAQPKGPYLPPMSDASAVRPAPWPDPNKGPEPLTTQPQPYGATGPKSLPPLNQKANAVEIGDLAPVMTSDGSGLPMDLWNGLDIAAVEAQLARLDMPPRSPAVNNLWRRLLQADASPPGGAAAKFHALRAEAYRRSGLLQEQADALAKATGGGGGSTEAVLMALRARAEIASGRNAEGCAAAKDAGSRKAELPKRLAADVIVLAGYCAAVGGNPAAAGLAADLAREEGHEATFSLAALDAIALGPEAALRQKVALPKSIDAVDYRLLMLTAPQEPGDILQRADASVLAVLVSAEGTEPKLRLAAAEAAARMNVITPDRLAEVYRAHVFAGAELGDPLAAKTDPLTRRAQLLKAADAERTPQRKTRLIRGLLDDARRSGLYVQVLRIVAKPIAGLTKQVEIGWFAETAVESMLAAERYDDARTWAAFGQSLDRPGGMPNGAGFEHWLALIDIADPSTVSKRGTGLASVERMALAGRFQPEQLHRLATVLDALDYQVPIPLWDAASKTPQPTSGHLPETGVLSELQDAAKKREFGRTVLLTLRTLGPGGAEGAHMIALGDAIRALKRAGLESDARRLGFEALFAAWPRSAT